MLNCTDEDYQGWWEGKHLAFHTTRRYPGDLGNLVYFDEYVGRHRLRLRGRVVKIVPGKEIVWQMIKVVRLPAWLCLEFQDSDEGVRITHTITAGFGGVGRLVDPILRLYFSDDFEKEMNQHAQTEFTKLGGFLSSRNREIGYAKYDV
jgi:hypothetical protein